MQVDLNCDMGESFGAWTMGRDEEMMKYISSANVAGGFHAGDPHVMRRTVELAKAHGVAVGIHAGFPDLVGFGRRYLRCTPQEVQDDLIYQLGALREFASLYGLKVQHVKPHGALYMMMADDEDLSRAVIDAIQRVDSSLILYCMEASATYRVANEMGQRVAAEFYAGREYANDGKILFTRKVETALDPVKAADRVLRAVRENRVTTAEGEDIPVRVDSICIHGDTPGAPELARVIRQHLMEHGVEIRPFEGASA
ncbi:LamB/YcsF family protein [Kyrpidia spormannii]|uniref:5-oxoprolinase subunit A n=1 Tax=Kyrpidia spormannii TaxID=2055160 RepID=A0A6F9E2Z8_9BACL|nr:5-oxoprolinase subunit PxpA [Kyrpidia spormannii]CAB3391198.1 oxoprolinase subunit A [Kyrpidia spormannii]